MKYAVIAVSAKGAALAQKIAAALDSSEIFVFEKYLDDALNNTLSGTLNNTLSAGAQGFQKIETITRELWNRAEGLIFICASGIAVRSIAPLVQSKYIDPAIVVCPDNGSFAISLLSGHEGGANALAEKIAEIINAVPVITTASEASPRILPRSLVVGMGFKRGIGAPVLYSAIKNIFNENSLSLMRICTIASIDIKGDERGLIDLGDMLGAPLKFFSAEELNSVHGDFEHSDFVQETTGVDNVCERAAVLAGRCGNDKNDNNDNNDNNGNLIVKKTALNGVTVAVFEKEHIWQN